LTAGKVGKMQPAVNQIEVKTQLLRKRRITKDKLRNETEVETPCREKTENNTYKYLI